MVYFSLIYSIMTGFPLEILGSTLKHLKYWKSSTRQRRLLLIIYKICRLLLAWFILLQDLNLSKLINFLLIVLLLLYQQPLNHLSLYFWLCFIAAVVSEEKWWCVRYILLLHWIWCYGSDSIIMSQIGSEFIIVGGFLGFIDMLHWLLLWILIFTLGFIDVTGHDQWWLRIIKIIAFSWAYPILVFWYVFRLLMLHGIVVAIIIKSRTTSITLVSSIVLIIMYLRILRYWLW